MKLCCIYHQAACFLITKTIWLQISKIRVYCVHKIDYHMPHYIYSFLAPSPIPSIDLGAFEFSHSEQCQRMFKLSHNCTHLTCEQSNAHTRLQQYMNRELPDVQAGFRKDRGTRDQIANIRWLIEKVRDFQKTSTSALSTMPKPLTVWIITNWKILKEMGIPGHLYLPPEKSVCRSRGNS